MENIEILDRNIVYKKTGDLISHEFYNEILKEIRKEQLDKLGVLLFTENINLIDENKGEVSFIWVRNKLSYN
jgi:hypothetical protein